jgi:hypothetical protein
MENERYVLSIHSVVISYKNNFSTFISHIIVTKKHKNGFYASAALLFGINTV